MSVRSQRAVFIPHIAVQFPGAALLYENEDLLSAKFERPTRIMKLGIRHFSYDSVVTVELVIAEGYGVWLGPSIALGEVFCDRAGPGDSVAPRR